MTDEETEIQGRKLLDKVDSGIRDLIDKIGKSEFWVSQLVDSYSGLLIEIQKEKNTDKISMFPMKLKAYISTPRYEGEGVNEGLSEWKNQNNNHITLLKNYFDKYSRKIRDLNALYYDYYMDISHNFEKIVDLVSLLTVEDISVTMAFRGDHEKGTYIIDNYNNKLDEYNNLLQENIPIIDKLYDATKRFYIELSRKQELCAATAREICSLLEVENCKDKDWFNKPKNYYKDEQDIFCKMQEPKILALKQLVTNVVPDLKKSFADEIASLGGFRRRKNKRSTKTRKSNKVY